MVVIRGCHSITVMGTQGLAQRMAAAVVMALLAASCTTVATDDCEPDVPAGYSVARMWNEQLLDAIRRDFPAPTLHSRNLFHVSAAMWDAWAAYDPCLLYTSPSPRDRTRSRMPSSA